MSASTPEIKNGIGIRAWTPWYIIPENKAPNPIPISKAMYMVAIALPMWFLLAKSLVQAARVGVVNPHAKPNKIADRMTVQTFKSIIINPIAATSVSVEKINTGIRPYVSDDFEKQIRMKMEAIV